MKKRVKKLSLHRETLLHLEGDLRRVAGAVCTIEDMTTCVCTNACNSGGTGTRSAGCSGPRCPTLTIEDMTCCGGC